MKRTDTHNLKQFWLEKGLDEKFTKKCNDKGIALSKWVRSKIEEFVKEIEK